LRLDHFIHPIKDHPDWNDFYQDVVEEVPIDLLKSKGLQIHMTVYVDADHSLIRLNNMEFYNSYSLNVI
jgi:hypothetical protein